MPTMPNHDTTRMHVVAPEPEQVEDLMRFVRIYRDVDNYQPINLPGLVDEWTGEPLPERMDHECLSHAFAPMPIGVRNAPAGNDPINPPWYQWAMNHWGTKWGTYEESHRIGDDRIIITFDSAWSPPWTLIGTLALAYPMLRFEGTWYSEFDGMVRRWSVHDQKLDTVDIGARYADDEEELIELIDLDGNVLTTKGNA